MPAEGGRTDFIKQFPRFTYWVCCNKRSCSFLRTTIFLNNMSKRFFIVCLMLPSAFGLRAQTDSLEVQKVRELREARVSALRAKEQNPVTFTNLGKKEIEKQNFGQDLPFLLSLTPSTVVNSDAGAGIGYTGIRIRGTDPTRINVTINGIPLNDVESQGVFWVNMPDFASSTDNIQVQRGVGTSTNGAGAFGASVNLQTEALHAKPYTEIANTIGSFATRKHTLKLGSGMLENNWSFDGRLSLIQSDGFIDRSRSDLKSFFISASHIGKKSMLTLNLFSGKEITYQAWNGIPEARLRGDVAGMNTLAANLWMSAGELNHLLSSGNRTYNSFRYANQTDNYQQDHYQLFYTVLFNPVFKFNIGLHYTYGRGYYEEYRVQDNFGTYKLKDTIITGSDTITSGDFIRRRWLDNDFYGTVFSFSYQQQKLTLIAGGGLNRYEGRHFGEIIWAQYSQGSQMGHRFYQGISNKVDMNLYTKASYKINQQMEAFADLQYRSITYKTSGENFSNSNYFPYTFDLNYQFFNPKAGLTFRVDEHSNVYAYLGVANREPVRDDIVQASLKSLPAPERLFNYELGYRRKKITYEYIVNLYFMDYTNQLVTTGQINDVGAYNRVNVPSSYRAGIELSGGLKISRLLDWQATLTYSQNKINEFTEYVDDWDNGGQVQKKYSNRSIAFSPDLIGSSMLTYSPLEILHLSFISKYVGEQYLDNTENSQRKLNAFFVNDVRIILDVFLKKYFRQSQLGLLVNNVFNTQYEPNGYTFSGMLGGQRTDFNYYYPQAGTNYLLNLVLKF